MPKCMFRSPPTERYSTLFSPVPVVKTVYKRLGETGNTVVLMADIRFYRAKDIGSVHSGFSVTYAIISEMSYNI